MSRTARKSRCSDFAYKQLEDRRLLATVIYGSAGDDNVEVTFVDATTVNIMRDSVLQQDVDVSEGLEINLLGGEGDRVWLDHRITADVVISHAETLELDGGDNAWQIGLNIENSGSIGLSSYEYVAGSVNGNVRFRDVVAIKSGSGVDDFMVDMSENIQVNDATKRNFLTVNSGDGDDTFLIYKLRNVGGDQYVGMDFHAEQGDDEFVFYGVAKPFVVGGAGYDTLDYSNVPYLNASFGDIDGDVWGAGNDLVIASSTGGDIVSARSSAEHNYRLDWVIDGNVTTVTERNTGLSLEYRNFDRFIGDYFGFDQFWVLETVEDLEIFNSDWVQISSNKTAIEGDLGGINHDIQISQWFQTIQEGIGPWGQTDSALPIPQDTDGVTIPRVIISDANRAEGSITSFTDNNTIRLQNGAAVSFTAESDSPIISLNRYAFRPELIFHGSLVNADYFLLEKTWADTTIYSHGGDDAFMFGSSNQAANGTLDGIRGEVNIVSGNGVDSIFANDQGFEGRSIGHGYNVSARSISDVSKFVQSSDGVNLNQLPYVNRFAAINYDETMDVVRINGSAAVSNEFVTSGNDSVKIVLAGSESGTEDLVRYSGPLDFGIVTEDKGTGSIGFYGDIKRIYFYGIEDIRNIFSINDTCAIANCDEAFDV